MILYVNERNEIKDVNSTMDTSLTALEVLDDGNPFAGWSIAKICCYKVNVKDGHIAMFTPYVDSRLLEHIDQLGKQVEVAEMNAQSKIDYVAMMADVDMDVADDSGEDLGENEAESDMEAQGSEKNKEVDKNAQ